MQQTMLQSLCQAGCVLLNLPASTHHPVRPLPTGSTCIQIQSTAMSKFAFHSDLTWGNNMVTTEASLYVRMYIFTYRHGTSQLYIHSNDLNLCLPLPAYKNTKENCNNKLPHHKSDFDRQFHTERHTELNIILYFINYTAAHSPKLNPDNYIFQG